MSKYIEIKGEDEKVKLVSSQLYCHAYSKCWI